MGTHRPPKSLDFLTSDPVPVTDPGTGVVDDAANRLPQALIDQLMLLRGVDGV